jgi:Ca-activated chloride channel family protein
MTRINRPALLTGLLATSSTLAAVLLLGSWPDRSAVADPAPPSPAIATTAPASPATRPATQPAAPQAVKIDLDKAVQVQLPAPDKDLSAAAFKTADGKEGWTLRIPGNRPIATPAYARIGDKPLLFVGGGYGSHEFYAFDAETGQVVWQMKTADDGPTAAVVEDWEGTPYVAFNTESCTVIVADARTGKAVWQEWLGDPLMSQPAIRHGKLFIAYPGGHPRGPQAGNAPEAQVPAGAPPAANQAVEGPVQDPANNAAPKAAPAGGAAAVGPAKGNGHRLLCADLRTGKHLWEQDITADVITAPVVEGEQVLFTCQDGTSFALDTADGKVVWKKQNAGTSAPLVADGNVVITQKEQKGTEVREGIKRLDPRGEERDHQLLAGGKAEYLKPGNAGNVALQPAAQALQDASVGFAAAPAAAGLDKAGAQLNVTTVVAGWAYQGPRAAYANGALLNAQGNHFNCVTTRTGAVAWQAEAVGKDVNGDVQAFSPPALGKQNLYVCSAQGHLMALDQKDGKVGFLYATGKPMAFQPALANGNVYAGTTDGMLICLKTGNKDADGWSAWGGNAAHTGDISAKKDEGGKNQETRKGEATKDEKTHNNR